ncbi:MAG TPA: hypothetical protein VHR38_08005 [Solirubrobacterales bacterium]|nr:hypothetical protein [Solirubrobacterales bacterium]
METTARTRRPIGAVVVLLCATSIVIIGFAGRADSKRFSNKVIKSVSAKRLSGAYSGVTEEGTAVKWRLTRRGKIVDFVVPITLGCTRENADLDGNGAISDSEPGEVTEFTKSITLRSAPLPGRKRTPHHPLDLPNGSNVYRPIPKRATAIEGELFAGSRNGPRTVQQPGRTLCSLSVNGRTSSHVAALDFDAKKTGR